MSWEGAFAIPDKLECANEDKEARVFDIRVEVVEDPDGRIHHYYLKPQIPPDGSGKLYFAGFREVEKGWLQVTDLQNPLPPPYQRCGITRALFGVVAQRHSASIRSSKARLGNEEMRSPDATGVWERLVRDHLARYDPSEDRFYYAIDD